MSIPEEELHREAGDSGCTPKGGGPKRKADGRQSAPSSGQGVTRRGSHVYPAQVSEFRDAGYAAEAADIAALDATEQHLRFVVHGEVIDMAEGLPKPRPV
jgi:hypothetical protein